MPNEPWDIRSIFDRAIEIPSDADRQTFLDEVCGQAPEVRQSLDILLKAHADAGNFLSPEPFTVLGVGAGTDPTRDQAIIESPGTVIGPYKLLEQIGEGGFGVVFMAEQQQPLRRKVALKVIKAGMDTKQVIARFEAERQALALMDHPNIAKVLDAGATSSGRPYFVMELVRGVPITAYCDEAHLNPRERLELFVHVCEAVQHAHQKGIIHRDIKPSNVLITLHDGKPVVKVIDFGIAKATGQQLTERTLFTNFAQMVGTPLYMSPEQAGAGLDIDTRSDIYGLGVLLYELLTGSTPFDKERLKFAAFDEIRRIIREEEPPRPSTRLSGSNTLASVAAMCKTEPRRLSHLFRGEVDWIVMKALEKDRSRRYETASGFAMDVKRYLNDEAVEACPPSAAYRIRKFVRRNKRALASMTVVAVAVLSVAGTLGWALRDREAHLQEAARERANRAALIEVEVTTALREAEQLQVQEKWPEALSAVKRAEGLMAGTGSDELRVRVRMLRKDLEMLLRLEKIRLSSSEVVEGSFDWDSVNRAYEQAFDDYGIDVLAQDAAARMGTRAGVSVELAIALDGWARIRSGLKDPAGEAALTTLAQAIDPDPWRRRVREATGLKDVNALEALAAAPESLRQPATSLTVLASALNKAGLADAKLAVLRQAQRQHPGDFWINYYLAYHLWLLGLAHNDEAVAFARAALAVRPQNPAAQNLLGVALKAQRKLDEAAACFVQAIARDPKYHHAHLNFAGVLREQKRLDEAVGSYRRTIALVPNSAPAHNGLGLALKDQGKLNEAIACFERAIELDPKYVFAHRSLGGALWRQKKLDEAVASLRTAIALGPESSDVYDTLGLALKDQGKLDEAVASHKRAIALDPKSANAHYNLGITLTVQGKRDEAVASFDRAIAFDPKFALAHNDLGIALREQGRLEDAIASYQRAIALDPKLVLAHYNLGVAQLDQEKTDEAALSFQTAIALDPKYANAHIGLGYVRDSQQKLNEATACFETALRLDSKNANAHYALGLTYWKQRKLDLTVASFKRAIDLDPKFANAHLNLANTYCEQRKPAEAIASYQQAIELDRNFVLAHLNLGMELFRQGKLDEAVASYTRVIELNPNHARAHNLLGMALRRLKKWDEAVAAHRTALKLDPKNASAYHELGVTLRSRGELGEAIASYKRAIELQPNNPERLADLAWLLTTCDEVKHRDPARAVELAQRAVQLSPDNDFNQSALGVAHYRAGNWKDSVVALSRGKELNQGQDGVGWFYLAMAQWKLGNQDDARKYYDRGVAWIDKRMLGELAERVEAAELLGVKEKQK